MVDAPEKIGRYEGYGPDDIRYTQPPLFITGQTNYIRADLVDDLRKALERAEPYLLDAVNEHVEKIKTLAGYDKLIARQEAYKRDVEEDRDLIRAALARIDALKEK